jgi:hypothetical protein
MTTVEDIRFDGDYLQAAFRFLFLNNETLNQIGATPVMMLPHALLMTFIQVFRNLIECQQFISSHGRKMMTLLISNEKIIDWDRQIDVIDYNIDKIYVLCDTYFDYLKMKQWRGCYQNKIQDVYQHDDIDYNLLRLGIDYLHSIKKEFHSDRGVLRKICTDGNRLAEALAEYFQNQMDDIDETGTDQ